MITGRRLDKTQRLISNLETVMTLQTDKKKSKGLQKFHNEPSENATVHQQEITMLPGTSFHSQTTLGRRQSKTCLFICLEKSCHTLSVSDDASTAPESELADVSQLSDDATVFMFDVLEVFSYLHCSETLGSLCLPCSVSELGKFMYNTGCSQSVL